MSPDYAVAPIPAFKDASSPRLIPASCLTTGLHLYSAWRRTEDGEGAWTSEKENESEREDCASPEVDAGNDNPSLPSDDNRSNDL
ncbi:hypothetical protein EYF80_034969 [Liparis tanakae]|uniref:Uncharacterized protein n=1 Tax=Liparis tanakae TaxID=230148 RepID=A0A4Z2GNQ8_9TELE|nr:hypothetical protein EYF80_034969 [Liparis tanakae]